MILEVQNLSKRYQLGAITTRTISLDLHRWFARMHGKDDSEKMEEEMKYDEDDSKMEEEMKYDEDDSKMEEAMHGKDHSDKMDEMDLEELLAELEEEKLAEQEIDRQIRTGQYKVESWVDEMDSDNEDDFQWAIKKLINLRSIFINQPKN